MRNFILSAFIGLTMLAFTGCTKNSNTEVETKCDASKKCGGTTKCNGDKM